jgi:hypothetical protein
MKMSLGLRSERLNSRAQKVTPTKTPNDRRISMIIQEVRISLFVMETRCVLFEVRTESLSII